MRPEAEFAPLAAELSRRSFIRDAGLAALAALVASTGPVVRELLAALPAQALEHPNADATLQAFADTILPGRPATVTDLGNVIHPGAIAGVDAAPGAVEADALALFHSPFVGFDAVQNVFLADLEARSVRTHFRPFLSLPFGQRVAVVLGGLSAGPSRTVFEAAAAIPFAAFCNAAANPNQTAERASGYRVMGLPGAAPRGYLHDGYSYGRKLSRERTRTGYLP